MALTLADAARLGLNKMESAFIAEMERSSTLLDGLPPAPPRSRWQRFKDRIRHYAGYRLVLRHTDARCDCEDY